MRTVTWDLAGQVSACVDRLHALSRRRGTTGCRQRGGKVLCVQQHPYVHVIGSLAFESLLKILREGKGGNLVTLIWRDISLNPSRTDMLLLDTTAALSSNLWPGGCAACDDNFGPNHHFFYSLHFFMITLPKTPAIQHAKIKNKKNKSNLCSCKMLLIPNLNSLFMYNFVCVLPLCEIHGPLWVLTCSLLSRL